MKFTCPGVLAGKGKAAFDKVVEWDKNLIKKCQTKFGWTHYNVVVFHLLKDLLLEQYYYDRTIKERI